MTLCMAFAVQTTWAGPPDAPIQELARIDGSTFYDSERLTVSALYPNPATDKVKLDYRIYDAEARVALVMRNVLGSEVGKYRLGAESGRLTLTLDKFKAGVYFYTLVVDEKSVMTKKFVVSK